MEINWGFTLFATTVVLCLTTLCYQGCQQDHESEIICFGKGGVSYHGSHCYMRDEK